MAPAGRSGQSVSAEISLVNLKNCLVNLPSSLVSLLLNLNTPAQNVIVELSYRDPASTSSPLPSNASQWKSIYVGWTGMPSKRKLAPIVSRDGISGIRGNREQELSLVEVDAIFARTLGLSDGLKITASLHFDPPLAHTVNIEPLTPTDWEIIELHATFLELNLLSQIRALPNPSFVNSKAASSFPLTLHLSPTSTANIVVTSLKPSIPTTIPFAKISPDAEVIVAPKTRAKTSKHSTREARSVASTSKRSGKSGASSTRRKADRDIDARPALYLRGLDRQFCGEHFDETPASANTGLRVWVDSDIMLEPGLKGVKWACITIVNPSGNHAPLDPQKQQQEIDAAGEAGKPTLSLVARILPWEDPPDAQHIALSTFLCTSLNCQHFIGGVVRIEAAPEPTPVSSVQKLKVYPFSSESRVKEGIRFGGESRAEREEASRRITELFSRNEDGDGIFEGPLTDGMILGSKEQTEWDGGIIRFDPAMTTNGSASSPRQTCHWYLGSEKQATLDVQSPIPRPTLTANGGAVDAFTKPLSLVGINPLLVQLEAHLVNLSSVLLTGAQGSGKTDIAKLIGCRLREQHLFHAAYFSCRKLVTDETRVGTIKETLTRLFMRAAWGARLGGRSLVVLDDLDKICPSETELEVGNDNQRSRQVSEIICSIVRQYCSRDSGVVLLATAQGKESLNNIIVGGHVVREILAVKAPDKEGRRQVLENVVNQNVIQLPVQEAPTNASVELSRPSTSSGESHDDDGGWMEGSSASRASTPKDGFIIDEELDFLDLAGETDGYMPGDLVLLVSRARSEALIRSVNEQTPADAPIRLCRDDFDKALKGFTPASLRNVTLQTSTTTFAAIGGLKETRKILMETLQYPTTYAPIFAQCPLRLRSGLLLYGYPGCGKTLLASAVAGECGLNFISVKGPEILNKYIGASEKSVRDLFERAEAARPCVLFFDEFDSIAPKRGHDSTGVTDRVVNQLLTQMDGAEGLSGVYVLAATSRPDLIDPALLRPGRLDKSLLCDLPSLEDRIDILQALSTKLSLSDEVMDGATGGLREIARRTEGYSGADLQALIYDAHLEAIHDTLAGHDEQVKGPGSGNATRGASRVNGTSKGSITRDFVQFRYGEQEEMNAADVRGRAGQQRSKQLAMQAEISAKLEAIRQARKQEKLARRGRLEGDKLGGVQQRDTKEQQEVIIMWKHIIKSLENSRASMSPEEMRRLRRIYTDFVSSRSGDMPNGEGPTEVGGRSSLM